MKVHEHTKMVFPKAFYTDLNSELCISHSELNVSSGSYLKSSTHPSFYIKNKNNRAISSLNYLKLA